MCGEKRFYLFILTHCIFSKHVQPRIVLTISVSGHNLNIDDLDGNVIDCEVIDGSNIESR